MTTIHPPQAGRSAFPLEATLPALRLIPRAGEARRLSRWLKYLLLVLPFALYFVPWQQTVSGSGRVVAYVPVDREQTLEATVSGRVMHVWVIEGQHVVKGQALLEITDNDPAYLDNLKRQMDQLRLKFEFARAKVTAYTDQMRAFEEAKTLALSAADSQISIARQKVRAEQQALLGAEAEAAQSGQNRDREQNLFAEGLTSKNELEQAEREFRVKTAKVEQSEAYLAAAQDEVLAKTADRERIEREATAKIESADAQIQEAQGEVTIAEKDIASLEITLGRQGTQIITAPRDGTILRVYVAQNAQQLKQGDSLVTIVPDTDQRAVELWIDGNDVSLLARGRPVRLQFEGWPAVQFSGWPSVAVGTFGGKVQLIDATGNDKGQFRILILPDAADQPWPSAQYLRQGGRANGWVLLDQVRMGWEVWRRLNGFPPVVASSEPGKSDSK